MPEGEFEFIAHRLRPLAAGSPGALDLLDDAALLDPPAGAQLVLTKDAMVAGVHFLPDDPAPQIAKKLLRVNLSDLAAMGAAPLGYLLALARPAAITDAWLAAFCAGLAEDQAQFGIRLLGGDTVSTPGPLTLSLTAIGEVPEGQALLRSGAKPGDDLYVSGTLGDAALGLQVLQGEIEATAEAAAYLAGRYRVPPPRLALGQALRGLAHAAIDISDGLLADLGHILETSRLGAEVRADDLPLSVAAQGLPGARDAALSGGDDYELLFTAPPARRLEVEALARTLALPLTRIGQLSDDLRLRVLDRSGRELPVAHAGWRHF
jgi:thiamine-monophosphate kinase